MLPLTQDKIEKKSSFAGDINLHFCCLLCVFFNFLIIYIYNRLYLTGKKVFKLYCKG